MAGVNFHWLGPKYQCSDSLCNLKPGNGECCSVLKKHKYI